MNQNVLLKLLSSLPVIFIFLYFIPFLGICLLILRLFTNSKKKQTINVLGILSFVPKFINSLFNLIKLNVPYLNDLVSSDIYNKLFGYGKFVLTIGIIAYILNILVNKLFNKTGNYLKSYITNQEKKNYEISKQNDMEIKEKQLKAQNTHVVRCSKCGATNMITSSTGKCQYCRNDLEYQNK